MSSAASPETSASLLMKIRGADDAAWREFFTVYTPIVFAWLVRRGLQRADAEDVAQEVMTEVARCIRNFEYQPERGRFRNWLGLIARRRLIAFWKKASRSVAECGLLSDEPGNSDGPWIDEFQNGILRVALENVRSHFAVSTWQAFHKNWLLNESAVEVAREMKVPIEMVYNSRSRVLKRLEAEVLRLSDDCAWLSNP